jgi:uncharacterized protein (DUF1501 family)
MNPMLALSRRGFLGAAAGVAGLTLARSASAAADRNKLVVIIARGAMDGLSATPPYGDPDYARLRGRLAIAAPGQPDGALRLDDHFGLHPAMTSLHAMAQAGQVRIAPAVAIPGRIRSHFEAQDMLENGSAEVYGLQTGWLNRALQAQGSARGLSVGAQTPLLMRGKLQLASWAPGPMLPEGDRVAALLQDLYRDDPLLGPALASGLETEAMARMAADGDPVALRRPDAASLGRTVAKLMAADGGADVAVVSLDGFDTHANQGAAKGQLANRLGGADALFGGLKEGLGPLWSRTVVVMATEFGRTARVNGTGGTDHGTASSLILAGGGLKTGGLIGDWPGLSDAKLYENRDLAPTLDVRSVFKGVLRDHMGLDRAALDTVVFPDSGKVPALQGLGAA